MVVHRVNPRGIHVCLLWSCVILFLSSRVLCGAVRVVCLCVTCSSSIAFLGWTPNRIGVLLPFIDGILVEPAADAPTNGVVTLYHYNDVCGLTLTRIPIQSGLLLLI